MTRAGAVLDDEGAVAIDALRGARDSLDAHAPTAQRIVAAELVQHRFEPSALVASDARAERLEQIDEQHLASWPGHTEQR